MSLSPDARRGRWAAACLVTTATILLPLLATCCTRAVAATLGWLPCKYSVRDVGFVDVQPSGWRLLLQRPAGTSDVQFQEWNRQLRQTLQGSRLEYVWVEAGQPLAEQVFPPLADPTEVPRVLLRWSGNDGQAAEEAPVVDRPVPIDDGDWLAAVRQLLTDPVREEILQAACAGLCAIVLIEGLDRQKNELAEADGLAAVQRVESQMWTYEKPVSQGPRLIRVGLEQQAQFPWLLPALGLEETPPAARLGIVFGQGRRMGDFSPPDAEPGAARVHSLVTMAAICGRDCECDLDRDWLYGFQILHHWTTEWERLAESTLNFDPHSAYVKAEVAQILRKTGSRASGPADLAALGGGLVIHDLDLAPAPGPTGSAESSPTSLPAGSLDSSFSMDASRSHESSHPADSTDAADPRAAKERGQAATDANSDPDRSAVVFVSVPWWLIVGLAVAVLAVAWWMGLFGK